MGPMLRCTRDTKELIAKFTAMAAAKTAAELAVEESKQRFRLPDQRRLLDIKEINIPFRFTHAALLAHYVERREYNQQIFRFKVPVLDDDGTPLYYIPITSEKEQPPQKRFYYIVQMTRPQDQARLRILVEAYSGYIVAFQVVYVTDLVLAKVKWCCFADQELISSLFEEKDYILYKCAYSFPEAVTIDEDEGERIFDFLESFRLNMKQDVTIAGRIRFDTLFFTVAEAARFGIIEHWITTSVGQIPFGYSKIIKVWSKLSKCIYYLHIYRIQLRLYEEEQDEDLAAVLRDSAKITKLKWATAQLKIQEYELQFFPRVLSIVDKRVTLENGASIEDVVLNDNLMRRLAGGNDGLLLLRHDPVLCNEILIRLFGYRGPL